MALHSIIFIGFLFCLTSFRHALPAVEVNGHLLDTVITTQMSNVTICQQLYDHCMDGNVPGGDGGERWSPDDHSWVDHIQLLVYGQMRCFCDVDECRKYGDCCPDIVLPDIERAAAAISTHVQEINRQETMTNNGFECQGFTLNNYKERMRIYVYMRTSCPVTWQDNEVDDLCHRRASPETLYDYTLDLPVTSQATNVTYRNVYCAICNDDTVLEPLHIKIHCPLFHEHCMDDWTQWQYVAGQQRWRHLTETRYGYPTNMTFEMAYPDNDFRRFFSEHGIRACPEDLMNTCPSHWSGDSERRLCSAYALMVSAAGPGGLVLYKNRHCAVCNGVAADAKMSCPPEPVPNLISSDFIALISYDSPAPSYSMLVDFMNNNVKTRSMTGTTECGYGEIFDAIRKTCRPYTCGQRYRIDNINGRCIKVEPEVSSTEDIVDDQTIFRDCPLVTFYEDQFVYLSYDTIYVNETDTIYDKSDYELVNDTTVIVCSSLATELLSMVFTDAKAILSTVCVLVSLICLIVHILVHLYLPELRNLPGKNLLSLSVALFVAQFFFTFGMGSTMSQYHGACVTVAAIIHLCFLATFFWMNVMAFDVSRTFSGKSNLASINRASFVKYSLYAWLTPMVIVGLALTNDLVEFLPGDIQPRYAGHDICWMTNGRALLVFFVAPLALLVTSNTALFAFTVVSISRTTRAAKFARETSSASGSGSGSRSNRIQIVLYVKLALIMGLTWLFGLVASLAKVEFLWYLFIVFNALQGAFIFFAFTFKRKTLHMVHDRFRGKMAMRGSTSTANYQTQMTSKSV